MDTVRNRESAQKGSDPEEEKIAIDIDDTLQDPDDLIPEDDTEEDPLADVRIPSDGQRRIFSPRNIALALIAVILVFFGGYFAAFTMARQKYNDAAAELSTSLSVIDSQRTEISELKDSLDALHTILETQPTWPAMADTISSGISGR